MVTISLPEQLVRTRRFTFGLPERFTITPDGATVLFLCSRGGEDPATCLWKLDLNSGTRRLLADPTELFGGCASLPDAKKEPPGQKIDGYATDDAVTLAAYTQFGNMWTVGIADGKARHLPAKAPVIDPRPDPAGRRSRTYATALCV